VQNYKQKYRIIAKMENVFFTSFFPLRREEQLFTLQADDILPFLRFCSLHFCASNNRAEKLFTAHNNCKNCTAYSVL
jgi:hypothetical protein